MAKDKKKLPKGKSDAKPPIPQKGSKLQINSQKAVNPSMLRRGSARGR
jgi:hypothetical protein